MKWFTFLLRHGIVVAIVIGIAITYVYRQQLFPKFFEQETGQIKVVKQAEDGQLNESGKDTSGSNEAVNTGQLDSSVSGQEVIATTPAAIADPKQTDALIADKPREITTTEELVKDNKSADVSSADDVAVAKLDPLPSDNPSDVSRSSDVIPQKDSSNALKGGQQNAVLEAGVALDEFDSRGAMADKRKQVEPAKPIQAAQGDEDTAVITKEDPSTINKDSSHPADMAAGMMKDPVKSMSGVIQNPAQAMSGMMRSATPDRGDAINSTSTHTQPISPGGLADANNSPKPSPPPIATAQGTELSPQQHFYQIINKARHAYWQGQYPQSVAYYQDAIMLMPESADGHGELGNVFYAQGEWDKAGESLYQAAIRLLDEGRKDKAKHLLSIIRGLKHERAVELDKRLQAQEPGK